MDSTRRMPRAAVPRILAAPALALVLIGVALTGCAPAAGDRDIDGDYFADNRGSPGTIRIAGDAVTFTGFACPPGSPGASSWNAEESVGTLDADRTEVTWTEPGAWSGMTSFAVVRDGIDLGGYVFRDLKSPAGAAELERATSACEEEH